MGDGRKNTMSIKLWYKIKKQKTIICWEKFIEEFKRIAVAVLIVEYLLAGGYYFMEKNGWLDFLHPKTVVIEVARAAEIKDETVKTAKVEEKKPFSIEEEIKKAFPENPDTMLAIAKAESRLNPKAHNDNSNGTIDTGIFQINSVHGYGEQWLQDPANNIKAARAIYEKQGLKAWATYNYAIEHNRPI